ATECLRSAFGDTFSLSTICGAFNSLRTKRCGTVDKHEFVAFMTKVVSTSTDHEYVIEHDTEYTQMRERDLGKRENQHEVTDKKGKGREKLSERETLDLRALLASPERLRALFNRHDTNCNQLLERKEWSALPITLGLAEADEGITIDMLYDYLDTDRSEGIDWAEFQAGIEAAFRALSDEV
ncbi:hypothetical protein KIPB_004955, partial [Kipferlia bialata]